MGIITKSIGTSGRDYSTIQAWEDALPANLVTDGNSQVGELYNDSEFAPSGKTTISGQTTSATYNITLKCAAGHSFYDHADKLTNPLRYDQSKGVGVLVGPEFSGNGFEVASQYVNIDGIQFRSSYGSYGNGLAMLMVTSSFCTVKNCIGKFDGGNSAAAFATNGASDFVNCLVYGTANAMNGIPSASTGIIAHCTVAYIGSDTTTNTWASYRNYGNPLMKNFAAFGFKFFGRDTTAASGSGYNATNLAAGNTPGSNNQYSLVASDQFVNVTPGSEDFRLKAGSGMATTGNQYFGISADIVKTTRSTTVPSIGAWEYAAAAGANNVNPGAGSLTLTGQVPTVSKTSHQILEPGSGSIGFTGYAPGVTQSSGTDVLPGAGSLTISGQVPSITLTTNLAPGAGSITLTGFAPGISQPLNALPGTASLTMTGYAPGISQTSSSAITPDPASLTLTGYVPSLTQSGHQFVLPAQGAVTFTGLSPAIGQPHGVDPSQSGLTLTGQVPGISQTQHRHIDVEVGGVVLTGFAPLVTQPRSLGLLAGSLSLTGLAPTISVGLPVDSRYARPKVDVNIGNWMPSSGTSLSDMLSELEADPTNYISASSAGSCELRCNPVEDPGTLEGHVMGYQVWSETSDGCQVILKQGDGSVVATWEHLVLPTEPTVFYKTLSTGEAANITDYSDLHFEFKAL